MINPFAREYFKNRKIENNLRFSSLDKKIYEIIKDIPNIDKNIFLDDIVCDENNKFIRNDILEILLLKKLDRELSDNFIKNIPLYVYYHIYGYNDWLKISQEQISQVFISGLYSNSDKIFINFVGNKSDFILLKNKYSNYEKIDFIHTDFNSYEFSTIELIQSHSQKENFKGIYIHTKGSSINIKDTSKEPKNFWRIWMSNFIVSKWKSNYYLLDLFDIVGVNFKRGNIEIDEYWKVHSIREDFRKTLVHTDHFGGNFWWFNSSYIRNIPIFKEKEKKNRFNAEWFVFRNKPKYFNWTTNIKINDTTSSGYINKLMPFIGDVFSE